MLSRLTGRILPAGTAVALMKEDGWVRLVSQLLVAYVFRVS